MKEQMCEATVSDGGYHGNEEMKEQFGEATVSDGGYYGNEEMKEQFDEVTVSDGGYHGNEEMKEQFGEVTVSDGGYHGKADVGLLERRSIVGSIAGDSNHLAVFPPLAVNDSLHQRELVLR